jgi:hypothetical protein
MSLRPMGEEELSLTVAEARALPETVLRERFWLIVENLRSSFGDMALPANFPKDVGRMTRTQILAALMEHAYWFDPKGGHPPPASPD